jgi:hypothetical protein
MSASEVLGMQLTHQPPHRLDVLRRHRASADRAVRVGGRHQALGQIGGQPLVRQVMQAAVIGHATGQGEQHRQGLLDLGGHHTSPSNSATASARVSAVIQVEA